MTLYSVRVDPYFLRATLSREANRKSQKLFLCAKMAGKHGGVPLHLNKANLHSHLRQ